MEKSNCRSCGAPVFFIRHDLGDGVEGALMIMNYEPDHAGEWQIFNGRIRNVGGLFDAHEGPRYTTHYATCPQADQWRKKHKKKKR